MTQIGSQQTSSQPVRTITNSRLARVQFFHALGILVLPPLIATVLFVVLPSAAPGLCELTTLAVMYLIAGLGVDVGFHRYFTHRSFQCPRAMQGFWAIAGMMAAPGTLLSWVATHRQHHESSDHDGDPHSPIVNGHVTVSGFWHAHAGWLFSGPIANPLHYAPDIVRDPLLTRLNRLYFLWIAMGFVIPFAIGLLVHRSLDGALLTMLWGAAIRMTAEHHVILSVNSVCHCFGRQRYSTRDHSRNNLLLAVPSLGESLHNNHHAFPSSAMYGHRWWEIDLGGYLIRALQTFGLAWSVKTTHKSRGSEEQT